MTDQRTRFEREIDEAARFNPASVVTTSYRAIEKNCDVCGRKHFELGPSCPTCRGCL